MKNNNNTHNVFIGGHYNFPNLPNEFALNSMGAIANMMRETRVGSNSLISFINDIRFSNFCSVGACDIDFTVNSAISSEESFDLEKVKSDQLANYDRYFSFTISDTIQEKLHTIIKTGYLRELSSFILKELYPNSTIVKSNKKINISALYYLVQASRQYIEKSYEKDLVFAMDYFLYSADKENFIPYRYRQEYEQIGVIWEKAIYNSASKIIRKIHQKGALQLNVEETENGRLFSCKAYDDSLIELRKEEIKPYFNAVNKCPLIIATLYYKLALVYLQKANTININYIIPSYDRSRVNLGTEAFFQVYLDELQKRFSNEINVNINNIYWVSSTSTINIVDSYSKETKTISIK